MSKIKIEIAYALPQEFYLKTVEVEEGTTIEQAILQSDILIRYPDIKLGVNKVGIFGRQARLADILQADDRIEIYRPLLADPKEIRRKRAEQQRAELAAQKKLEKAEKQAAKLAEREARNSHVKGEESGE